MKKQTASQRRRLVSASQGVEVLEGRRLFAASYTLTDLAPATNGVLHGGAAFGISDNGQKVAGGYDGDAVVWTNGVRQDLGFAGIALDVNNNGVAVGQTADGHPFVWNNGTKIILSLNGITDGVVNAVNNSGEVAGTISESGVNHGFVAALGGAAHDIGTIAGHNGITATGINDKGQVIGNADVTNASPQAFIFSGNAFHILGPLPGGSNTQTAHGITSDGTVAVSGPSGQIYTDGTTKIYHVYTIGSNGFGTPADKGTYNNDYDVNAADISEDGSIVIGNNDPTLSDGEGIVNTGSGFKLLDNLIDPALGWQLRYVTGVTDGGKIVGYGYDADGNIKPFLLTPVASNPTLSISGTVWNDTDADGTFDSNESASGVRTVYIDANGNGKLDAGETSTQSDANGKYTFAGLANGTYKVSRVLPSGYHLSNGGGASYVSVTLSGANKTGVNLGSAANAAPVLASISGVLFNDTDKDGFFDSNESASGVRTVYIDTNGNGKLDAGEKSVQSDAKGKYTFNGLAAGTYKVTRVFPAGYKLSNNGSGYVSVTVAAGQAKTGVNLGSKTA